MLENLICTSSPTPRLTSMVRKLSARARWKGFLWTNLLSTKVSLQNIFLPRFSLVNVLFRDQFRENFIN